MFGTARPIEFLKNKRLFCPDGVAFFTLLRSAPIQFSVGRNRRDRIVVGDGNEVTYRRASFLRIDILGGVITNNSRNGLETQEEKEGN